MRLTARAVGGTKIRILIGQPESLAATFERTGSARTPHRWTYRRAFLVRVEHGRTPRAEFDETADGNFLKLKDDREAVGAGAALPDRGSGTESTRGVHSTGRGGRRRAPGEPNIERVAL